MKRILVLLLLSGVCADESLAFTYAQAGDSTEIYLINSFVAPEKPGIFNVSFITSIPARTKLFLDNKYEFVISDTLKESHQAEINLTGFQFTSKAVPFYIVAEDSAGNKTRSDIFELDFPVKIKVEKESNFLLLGVFFGIQFLVPTPSFVVTHNNNFFALTKEIPLIAFRSSNINYPTGYFSIEYSHIFNADASNFFRLGYKHFFATPFLEYISPGFTGFTNFDGYNGYSAEISVGLFNILNTFTVYSRYRFNTQPSHSDRDFQEISIGIYSNFFSFHF